MRFERNSNSKNPNWLYDAGAPPHHGDRWVFITVVFCVALVMYLLWCGSPQ